MENGDWLRRASTFQPVPVSLFNTLPGLNMAEWIIRWGIPLGLLGGYVAAVASTGGNPTTMFYDLLEWLRSGILGAVPRFL